MTNLYQQKYDDFWTNLLPAYPISKGSTRLPIASELITLDGFDHGEFINNLANILETLLKKQANTESARQRAQDAGEQKLIPLIDSDYTGIVRFDCLWNPETKKVSVIELNADFPDGLLLHDKTYSVLASQQSTTHKQLLNELLPNTKTVVLHSQDSGFLDGYQSESDNLKDLGLGGEIYTDLKNTDSTTTVRRCLETTKMSTDMIDKLVVTKPRLINSISLRTLGYKDLLSTIEHPYLAKTFRLTKDKLNYCQTNQTQLVLKPANGCEGFGIYFGHQLDSEEWSKKLTDSIDKNYVIQELIPVPQMRVSLYDEGTILQKFLYYDLCPHFFIKAGKIIGAGHTLMRFSENPIVNVTQGGGIGYYKLISSIK